MKINIEYEFGWHIQTNIGINPPILLLDTKITITHFECDTRQLFETEEGSFVYYKDVQRLYKIKLEVYNRLLIKCTTFMEYKTAEETSKAIY